MTYPHLYSWAVCLKTNRWESCFDGWGEQSSYQPVITYYVIGADRAQALRQARRLAGFKPGDLPEGSRKGLYSCEKLEQLQ